MADGSPPAPRALRADAQRNREAILAAARAAFEAEGVLASLDGIAIRAGVGNATLYRNFATRDDLLVAVMGREIDTARGEAGALAREASPRDALARWLVALAWRLRIWHDLPTCLADAHARPDSAIAPSTATLIDCTAELLDRAQAAGVADPGVEASELFELITALSWAIDRFGDDEARARRRVELASAGVFSER